MADTFKVLVEYTDTFGGEANYCWVRRATIELPCNASRKLIMRRARDSVGLQGAKGKWEVWGDGEWHFKPYHCATILMAYAYY